MLEVDEARSTKRRRRTQAEIAALAQAQLAIVREQHPQGRGADRAMKTHWRIRKET